MIFYLGTHEPHWLARVAVPMMVSRNRLERLTRLPQANVAWVLDSGGFTELQQHGRWRSTAAEYASDIARYAEEVGHLRWAAPQDWMCEPAIIHGGKFKGVTFAGTGLTVAEHQARTIGNFVDLKALGAPVIPVLQGYTVDDYLHCVELYDRAGIDLTLEDTVGLGSVCRRENTDEIGSVVAALHPLRLHGFGCKGGAVRRYGAHMHSSDSMAWSLGGRLRGPCTHLKSRCANHLHWALEWREDLLDELHGEARYQLALF